MDQTGSQSDFFVGLASANWRYRQRVEASEPFKTYVIGLNEMNAALKVVGKSDDIDKIIEVEASLIKLENTQHQGRDPSAMSSLDAAVKDFDDMRKAIEIVKSPVAYKAAADTYRSNKKIHGVVADGCHEALNGHIARLGNRMSAVGISVPEKNVLRQRQANMRTVKDLYIELQREALGIEAPAKGRELER